MNVHSGHSTKRWIVHYALRMVNLQDDARVDKHREVCEEYIQRNLRWSHQRFFPVGTRSTPAHEGSALYRIWWGGLLFLERRRNNCRILTTYSQIPHNRVEDFDPIILPSWGQAKEFRKTQNRGPICVSKILELDRGKVPNPSDGLLRVPHSQEGVEQPGVATAEVVAMYHKKLDARLYSRNFNGFSEFPLLSCTCLEVLKVTVQDLFNLSVRLIRRASNNNKNRSTRLHRDSLFDFLTDISLRRLF